MATYGFVIDNRKCIGCHACTVACKSEHQVPVGVDRTWVKYVEKGTFPHNRRLFTVMRCNHCDWAPCVTICPVTALYRRQDGVVDFNNERCIGCKGCLQACPYDALYIDPESQTAAKCNFCTHRLEIGLQPSCVVVCPEQAIIAGDLDDPESEIAGLISRHPVQVRKPEKGTRPKLFYIDADEASLVPTQSTNQAQTMWSHRDSAPATDRPGAQPTRLGLPVVEPEPAARRVYDVRPRKPAWGWEVAAYTWTKSIAAGSLLAVLAARLLGGAEMSERVAVGMGIVALLFLTFTAALLVADLKQPQRFLYVLLRPQWRSWLVRGAYILTAYGGIVTAWLIANLVGARAVTELLLWPGAILAVLAAVYTAFLFAQAKGRDFWQNPLCCVHLVAQALVAGGAVWLIADCFAAGASSSIPRIFTACALLFSVIALLGEMATTPPTVDARQAVHWIIGRPMGRWFWGAGIAAGNLAPLAMLSVGSCGANVVAAILALTGLFVIESLWVFAPQHVPLS